MKPEAARALPPRDDQLMSQGDKLEFQWRSGCETGTRAWKREQIEWWSCGPTVRRLHEKSLKLSR